LGPKSVPGAWLPSPLAGCGAPAVLALGGDPPAVLEPVLELPAEAPCEYSADTADIASSGA